MPSFPWKKVKKTSLSQLVKEHVNSQSGSPLMVETGFPTSLVDLVVKNRGRFKKPSKKKKVPPPPPMAPPFPLPSPPPPPSPETKSSIDDEVSPLIHQDEVEDENIKMNQTCCRFPKYEEGWCNGGVSMNQGLVAVFKMFLVAVLVLGMNNLVMGIIVSAFLLFFLEYLGGFFSGLQRRARLLIKGIWEMFRAKVVQSEEEEDCVFKAPLHRQEVSKDFGYHIQEIEVVQETYVEDSQCVKEKIEECICDEKLKCVGGDIEGVVMEKGEEFRCESKEKKSHRAKMKSKMKKLVPKKFRKKKGSALESHMMLLDEIDYVIEGNKEAESSSMASRIDIVEDVGGAGESSKGLTDASVQESFTGIHKASIVGKDGLTETEHNSMYIVLFLAVLVGLIGGRVLALVFTLTCCLILKRGEGIRRFTKFPVIRPFAKKFS